MIPYIQRGDLTKLTLKRQKRICSCTPLCKEFYTISTDEHDFIICSGETRQFAFELLGMLGLVTEKLQFPLSKSGWTTEQEQFIKNYLKDEHVYYNGRIKYGTYSIIGEMLGKSREQVKHKIRHMEKEGKL